MKFKKVKGARLNGWHHERVGQRRKTTEHIERIPKVPLTGEKSPLESASNRLNDDAVGKAVWSDSRKSTLTHLVSKNDAELFVILDKEDVDRSFSMFVESDHSRLRGLVHKIHYCEIHVAPMRDLRKV